MPSSIVKLFAEFEGPNHDGDFSPEEERLLASYPQPADTAALPAWRQPCSEAEPPLDVAVCFHVIALHTFASLSCSHARDCIPDAFSLIEELMAVLLPAESEAGSEAANVRIAAYLLELSGGLDAEIAAHSHRLQLVKHGDTAPVEQDVPVLSNVALMLLQLVARCRTDHPNATYTLSFLLHVLCSCPPLVTSAITSCSSIPVKPTTRLLISYCLQVDLRPACQWRKRYHFDAAWCASGSPVLHANTGCLAARLARRYAAILV